MSIEIQPAAAKSEPAPLDGNILIDQFGRVFDYLRIAVNEQCNRRCIYCLPEQGVDFQPALRLLTVDEVVRIMRVVARLGVRKIRFTGGEPLLHKDIVYLVSKAIDTPGISSVHITTNGLLLGKTASALYDAGVDGINISIDTLVPDRFLQITRGPGLQDLLEGLSLALELGFPSVKVNTVVMRGFNDHEIGDFVQLTRDKPLTVRFIELMPFDVHQIWRTGRFLGAEKIIEKLSSLYPNLENANGSPTEQYAFRVPGYQGKVGVIPAFTRSLCGECSRVRLTADGKIRNCLYSDNEFNVKGLIQKGGTNEDIALLFRRAMWDKPRDGWEAQHRGDHHRQSMAQIGG